MSDDGCAEREAAMHGYLDRVLSHANVELQRRHDDLFWAILDRFAELVADDDTLTEVANMLVELGDLARAGTRGMPR